MKGGKNVFPTLNSLLILPLFDKEELLGWNRACLKKQATWSSASHIPAKYKEIYKDLVWPSSVQPGAQLLQDYQAAHGPEEGEEEAAVAELPVLPLHPGVCVRHASDLQKLCGLQRGERHESWACLGGMASGGVCVHAEG